MIIINGEPSDLAPGATLSELLDHLGAPDRGVAVAVDAEVVPRGAWGTFALADGARVEVLTAVQGG
ncbi:MAG TPA: sulfur carrier protein ThiS [Baekduia sp.]|uniref:sulfur carrier protein ThiS n=1 Tax=Baekduia sp. TaxID=2600305 RepID=UPI002B61AD52|nr:sulfur carrier protein ThiS [Baekduia sp.]HMJ33226.1 sulfur carrier protein ThiS [Baekduia sp.]